MLDILRSRYPALLALLAQLLALTVIACLLLLFVRLVDWRPSLWQAALAQGALAAALGLLVDEGWNLLKGKVDGFIEDSINKLADMAMNKAKSMLAGVADKAGGALQGFVNALRGPLGKITEQVRAKVMPILEKYRSVVAKLQTLAAK